MVFCGRLGVLLSRIALALLVVLSVGACGGGGGSGSDGDVLGGGGTLSLDPPVIHFPPGYAVTVEETVIVRGAVPNPASVTAIDVNGVSATSTDGFATWTAEVPLADGENTIVASYLPVGARTPKDTVRIRREDVALTNIADTAFDEPRRLMYHLHFMTGEIQSTNVDTGERRIVGAVPGGRRIAVSPSTGTIYVFHASSSTERNLYALDPASGIQSTVYEHGDGGGFDMVALPRALRMIINDASNRAIVMIPDIQMALVSIDLTTGAREIAAKLPSDGLFVDFVVNEVGTTAYALDHTRDGSLREIDLGTGNQITEYTLDNTEASHLAISESPGNEPILYYNDYFAGKLVQYRLDTRTTVPLISRGVPSAEVWTALPSSGGRARMWVDDGARRIVAPAHYAPEIMAFYLSSSTSEQLFSVLRVSNDPSPGAREVGLWGNDKIVYTGDLSRYALYVTRSGNGHVPARARCTDLSTGIVDLRCGSARC